MNYYNEIKKELINNEVYKKSKSDLSTYYNVGKLLVESGEKYGEGIIKEYSKRLSNELSVKYSARYLFDIRKFYFFSKVHPADAHLCMSHYRLIFPLKDDNEIDYYINQILNRNLSKI